MDRNRQNIGLPPRRRYPDLPERKWEGLDEEVGDDGNHATCAVHHGRARGTVVQNKAIFSIVHFEQRTTGEAAILAEFYKAAAGKAPAIARISKTYNLFLRR